MECISIHENGVLAVNPQRPLPEDILIQIFLHSARDEAPSILSPPLTLIRVCRYWRRLGISSPTLWAQVLLGVGGTNPVRDIRFLDLWLSRAGLSLLHIKTQHEVNDDEMPISLDPGFASDYFLGMQTLTEKVASVAPQWRSLDMRTLYINNLNPVLRQLTMGASYLEHLRISTKYINFFGNAHYIDLGEFPSLRSMRLMCFDLCPSVNSLPACNLTDLELRFWTHRQDSLAWLTVCPNLEMLTIRFFGTGEWSLLLDAPQITLSQLTHLAISSSTDDADTSPLFEVVAAPALRRLELNMVKVFPSELENAWNGRFLEFIERSGMRLERLQAEGTPLYSHTLIQVLQTTSQLTYLSLSGPVITDSFISALIPTESDAPRGLQEDDNLMLPNAGNALNPMLCPSLEWLVLRDFVNCSADTLSLLISFRTLKVSLSLPNLLQYALPWTFRRSEEGSRSGHA